MRTSAFEEDGDASVVSGKRQSANVVFNTLGARISNTIESGSGTEFRLSGMIGWNYNFGDIDPVASVKYQGGKKVSDHALSLGIRYTF